jgi:hypothetical protein
MSSNSERLCTLFRLLKLAVSVTLIKIGTYLRHSSSSLAIILFLLTLPRFHLTGLIHDLGKILAHPEFGSEPQWAVVGDTFPVGCAFSDKASRDSQLQFRFTLTKPHRTFIQKPLPRIPIMPIPSTARSVACTRWLISPPLPSRASAPLLTLFSRIAASTMSS